MSDFKTLQDELQKSRQQQQETSNQLTRQQAKLQKSQEALRQLNRVNRGQDDRYLQLQAKLEADQQALNEQVGLLQGKTKEMTAADADLSRRFAALSDPTELIENLPDDTPILLFPVRMETRFKKINNNDELWIRIYPDDCVVDSFQEILTESEIEQAKYFWAGIWQAGGIEEQQKAAWRALVASFGSGRALWIYQKYKPLNELEKPLKPKAEDLILTILTDEPLPAATITPATEFWKQVWLADGDTVKEQNAFQSLKAKLGNAAAQEVLEKYEPTNIEAKPPAGSRRETTSVSVSFILFPADDTVDAASSSWTQAPKANLLPDRFVVMGYNKLRQRVFIKTGKTIPSSLDMGIDPALPKADQIHATPEGNLVMNEGLNWLTDFNAAEDKGMAMKVFQDDMLSGKIIDGFDKVIVLGISMTTNDTVSSQQLQELLQHHYLSQKGFSVMPQGAATNNTEEPSGYSRFDNADQSYEVVFNDKDLFTDTTDSWQKKDGQWVTEALGLDSTFFKQVPHAGGNDMGEARAMNTCLWPATLGYFMEEMMGKVFTEQDITNTRKFFNEYVLGCGSIPAIRIGAQPYGILPTTVYSKLKFTEEPNLGVFLHPAGSMSKYLNLLHGVLRNFDIDWTRMSEDVAHVSKATTDPYQQVMDIIALQGSSVEFYQRYAEGAAHIYNASKFSFNAYVAEAFAEFLQSNAKRLLAAWGVDTTEEIPILSKFFLTKQNPLQGPVIDDVPLSETSPVRKYSADNKNYLEWLATVSLNQMLSENFGGNKAPTALLYIMLRQALMEQHNNTSIQLYDENKIFANAKETMKEPDMLYVSDTIKGDSKLKYLYQDAPTITKKPGLTVADYIQNDLRAHISFTNYYLSEVIKGLDFLQDRSTANLERAFTAHLDCCGYRLDAWMQGLIHYRLQEQRRRRAQRQNPNHENISNQGIFLGAYGYVENLFPENKNLTAVTLDRELDEIFNDSVDLPPLQKDPTNGGFIHAPSINQATTAAILNNAYLTNASKGENNPFSVNISSERVRLAQSILEGVRNGQSLSALLGYRFERGLHDKHSMGKGEVDVLIYPLRMLFPLASQNIKQDTPAVPENEPTSIEQVEARNTIDGLKLIAHVKKTGTNVYPFGFPIGGGKGQLPAANAIQVKAVTEEVLSLLNVNDAVSDLVMAESLHQAVQGNMEKSAANTDIAGKGAYPPETEFIKTPRSGISITNRVAVHFDSSAVASATDTPRAKLEPAMNKWLRGLLPSPAKIACTVNFTFPDAALNGTTTVTLPQLELDIIDLVYVLDLDSEKGMNELDDRLEQFVRRNFAKHPGAEIKIRYTTPIAGHFSFFEIASLVKSLNQVLLPSRHLEPSDLALPTDKNLSPGVLDDVELTTRIVDMQNAIKTFSPKLQALVADVASDADSYASQIRDLYVEMARFNIPGTGIGFITDGIRSIYQGLSGRIDKVIKRWEEKKTEYQGLLAGYPALANDEDRFALLQNMERIISTKLTTPLPATPALFKNDLENFRVNKFEASLQDT